MALSTITTFGQMLKMLRRKHAHHYPAFVQADAPDRLKQEGGPAQFTPLTGTQSWLKQINPELDNLRAALTWCLRDQHDAETGTQIALWLTAFWTVRGPHSEGREWLECALVHTDPLHGTLTRARILGNLTDFEKFTGDGQLAEEHAKEALAICRKLGNPFDIMIALYRLAFLTRLNPAELHIAQEEWLSIARKLGNTFYEGIALYEMGNQATHQNDLPRAIALFTESLRVLPTLEEGTRQITSYFQAVALWKQGYTERAWLQIQAALTCFRDAGFVLGVATVLIGIADCLPGRRTPICD